MSDESTLRQDDGWSGPHSEGPGSRIGPFLLTRRVGEGGFGVVFEAEQEQPVRRRVALKILKLGMDTREVIARFDAERQALALMEHPHIARVLDAGTTDSGRPYFVMELVEGTPIALYCDEHRLDVEQRLRLFDQVCAAVQHAHTKGVIHRDLKPSNVLVATQDGKPLAKVIDFGIAKATHGRLTERTLATELNQVMGTPQYMSPEQAEGSADIDTRTDIYSLGVILYELLTGSTPVDAVSLRSALFAELQRIICEVEPPRPSARLAQTTATLPRVAAQRSTEPRRLARIVRGELDWIVMKALEKERGRRYETANGLALDLRRYLAHEPVLAAPPSASYRMQKFVRRHKGAVAAGSAVAAALLAGIAGFAWQARIAEARADELQQVSAFQARMLDQVNPTQAGQWLGEDVRRQFAAALAKAGLPEDERSAQVAAFELQWQRVNATDAARELIQRTVLHPSAAAITSQFKGQPLVQAQLRQTLANVYTGLGLFEAATPLQAQALATRRRELGEQDSNTLESLSRSGALSMFQGEFAAAEPSLRHALASRRRLLGADHPDTLTTGNDLAELLRQQGRLEEAEPIVRDVLARRRRILGEAHPDTLDSLNNLGLLLDDGGRFDEAKPYYFQAMELSRRTLGQEHPDTLDSIDNYGALLFQEGDLAGADHYLDETLEKRRRVLGELHPDTINSINSLGVVRDLQKRGPEAEALYREAVAKSRTVLGDHPDALKLMNNLGSWLTENGKESEAEPFLRESLEKERQQLGNDHPSTLAAVNTLANLLIVQGRFAETERLILAAEADARRVYVGDNLRRLPALINKLGVARAGLGKFAEAEANLLEARDLAVRTRVPRHKDVLDNMRALIALYTRWDAVRPGQGYAAKRQEWQRRNDELMAMSEDQLAKRPPTQGK